MAKNPNTGGLPFLKAFHKKLENLENINTDFAPPTFWYSTGNYALNKILSGSYFKAIPQGRITSLVGPSGVGKSYISCNVIREAQAAGAFTLVLDSENALDERFMTRIGIDVHSSNFTYAQVVTIQDVTAVTSEFLVLYEKEYGRFNKDAPRVVIVLDSLGNCLTNSEDEKFEKGVQTGDQGASAKLKKHLLRTLVSRLARCNATFVLTDQVYPQDPLLGDGPWAITNGVKFAASQIGLVTKLKLKEETSIIGIKMRVENYKSRFVQPGTKIELEVPYATGLSRTEGLLDKLVEDKIITQNKAWYSLTLNGETKNFQRKDFTDAMALDILTNHPVIIQQEAEFDEFQSNADLAVEDLQSIIQNLDQVPSTVQNLDQVPTIVATQEETATDVEDQPTA